jgi:hypothetical protein
VSGSLFCGYMFTDQFNLERCFFGFSTTKLRYGIRLPSGNERRLLWRKTYQVWRKTVTRQWGVMVKRQQPRGTLLLCSCYLHSTVVFVLSLGRLRQSPHLCGNIVATVVQRTGYRHSSCNSKAPALTRTVAAASYQLPCSLDVPQEWSALFRAPLTGTCEVNPASLLRY